MFSASGDPGRQWCVIPPESSAGYSCFPWIQKTAASQAGCGIPRADESSQSCQRHHSSRAPTLPSPPPPHPKCPTGIENSTGPCLSEGLDVKYCMQNLGGTEGCWHRAAVSSSRVSHSRTPPFICKVRLRLHRSSRVEVEGRKSGKDARFWMCIVQSGPVTFICASGCTPVE